MTLADLLASTEPHDLRTLALVFGPAVHAAVAAAQLPTARHQIQPVALPDGRWFCCADLLSETQGIFAGFFAAIDHDLAAVVEVVAMADVVALLPVPEELP